MESLLKSVSLWNHNKLNHQLLNYFFTIFFEIVPESDIILRI